MKATEVLRRNPWSAAGAGTALVYAVEVAAKAGEPWPLLAVAPVVGLVVAGCRRWPLVATLGVVATFQVVDAVDPSFNENGGMAFLIAWLTTHYALGRRTSGWSARFAPLVAVGSALVIGSGDIGAEVDTGDLAYFLAQSLLPWAVGLASRWRHDHVVGLRAENERLEREQAEAARRAVTEERSRIARELHDVVSHAISVTVLQSRGARRKLGRDDESVREALEAIEHTNAAALSDMRRLLAVLRDTETLEHDAAVHEPLPSLARLGQLVEDVRAAGVTVTLVCRGDSTQVPPGVDLSAYRIVQEALTNVLRHGGRQAEAAVELVFEVDELRISVRNTGGDPSTAGGAGAGHGLIGIRERVAVVGGEMSARVIGTGGFEVRARLPYALGLT